MKFFVPGKPAPQGSKKHVGNGRMVESSAKTLKPWRQHVASVAQLHTSAPMAGPVGVRLDFVMPRPKSTPKRSTPHAIKRPDIDKLTRAILDALTGACFADDSQVVALHATKRLAEVDETPGVIIELEYVA